MGSCNHAEWTTHTKVTKLSLTNKFMKTIGIKIQKIVNINLVISAMNKLLSTKNVLYSSSPIIMFSTFNIDKSILPNGSCRQQYKSEVFLSVLSRI